MTNQERLTREYNEAIVELVAAGDDRNTAHEKCDDAIAIARSVAMLARVHSANPQDQAFEAAMSIINHDSDRPLHPLDDLVSWAVAVALEEA